MRRAGRLVPLLDLLFLTLGSLVVALPQLDKVVAVNVNIPRVGKRGGVVRSADWSVVEVSASGELKLDDVAMERKEILRKLRQRRGEVLLHADSAVNIQSLVGLMDDLSRAGKGAVSIRVKQE